MGKFSLSKPQKKHVDLGGEISLGFISSSPPRQSQGSVSPPVLLPVPGSDQPGIYSYSNLRLHQGRRGGGWLGFGMAASITLGKKRSKNLGRDGGHSPGIFFS